MMQDETSVSEGVGERKWVLVLDPAWRPAVEGEAPPVEAVIGAWLLEADGSTGPFQPNPDYVPADEDSPTDPVDAAVRLVVRGEYSETSVLSAMRDAMFGIALDEQGAAIVTQSPDGFPVVLVATAPAHARRLEVPSWQEISAQDLADSLPESGLDLLVNPAAPASMRVVATSFKAAVAEAAAGGPLPEPPFGQS
ncbi:type VII secretion system-associated protein [Saccharopolyspora sp. NPDC002686]|uniref:type VII secretion system-associated protein n=1 Tax=Saccharopolyspora sp. NPDC002686 TaxID=3154541 RepID=UPI00331E434A